MGEIEGETRRALELVSGLCRSVIIVAPTNPAVHFFQAAFAAAAAYANPATDSQRARRLRMQRKARPEPTESATQF